MKRQEPEKIGDVLRQTLEDQGMTERLYETRAIALWPALVGEEIAAQSARPYINKGLMTIHVRNASLRHELNMSRSSLVKIINESLGRDTIQDIKFK